MKKISIFILLVVVWFVLLFPKSILWEKFCENLYDYTGVELKAEKADMNIYILYNRIDLKKLNIQNSFLFDKVKIVYTLINPLHVRIEALFKKDLIYGDIELYKRRGSFKIESENIKSELLKGYFKKSKKGYIYEFDY